MTQNIVNLSLVVHDYDEAISFFTQKLNFQVLEDIALSAEKRWVRIAPAGSMGPGLVLGKAKNEQEKAAIGNQTGGRANRRKGISFPANR